MEVIVIIKIITILENRKVMWPKLQSGADVFLTVELNSLKLGRPTLLSSHPRLP